MSKSARLSVVIAATADDQAVARTLASVPAGLAERIVVFDPARICGDGWPPDVVCVRAEPGAKVGRLRRLGLDQARGGVVVFTEDSCVFRGDVTGWLAAFEDPAVLAATAPVVPAMGARALDWAVFLCEYAAFLPGCDPRPRLAGNAFAVRRSLADRVDPAVLEESALPALIASLGGRIGLVHGLEAGHVRRYGWGEAFRDRFRFGLSFGQARGRDSRGIRRWVGLVAGPAILASQWGRRTAEAAGVGPYRARLLKSAPLALGLLSAWSLGEWAGWGWAALGPRASRRRHETEDRSPAPIVVPAPSELPRCTPGPRVA